MKDGYRWDGHYLIWDLRDFIEMDLGINAEPAGFRNLTAHKVKEVDWPAEGVVFPLRAEYERINHTLEGMKERAYRTPPSTLTLAPAMENGGTSVSADSVPGSDQWINLSLIHI